MALLGAILLASCAGQPSANPTPGATSFSPSPAPSVPSAPPTHLPAVTPPPSVTPEPTMPGDLATHVQAMTEGVQLSIDAASVPLRAGVPIEVALRIENRGSKTVYWGDDRCGLPGSHYVHLVSEAWRGGVPHAGIAAEFKAFALEVEGHAGDSPLSIWLQPDEATQQLGCIEVGSSNQGEPLSGRLTPGGVGYIRELAAGASMEGLVSWLGTSEDPIPEGAADLVYSFRFSMDPEAGNALSVEARLASWIVSDEVVDFIPPGPAIDLALADEQFMTWLAAADTEGWINSSRTLDLEAGTWEIGLFRDGGPGFYATVTLDARTGEVLRHRFE
jgi:hypothetical protein